MSNNAQNKRGDLSSQKKRPHFDLKAKKDNTLRSLKEVEYFLRDFKRIAKSIKLYHLLK